MRRTSWEKLILKQIKRIKVTRGRQDWGKKKNKGEGNQMRVPLDRHMGSGRRMEKNKGLK